MERKERLQPKPSELPLTKICSQAAWQKHGWWWSRINPKRLKEPYITNANDSEDQERA
jgi:hypothetical protein